MVESSTGDDAHITNNNQEQQEQQKYVVEEPEDSEGAPSSSPIPQTKPPTTTSTTSGGAAHPRPQRGRPQKPDPEKRLVALMARNPSTWSSKDVVEWLEAFGLGQYRKTFIHHAVKGLLLPKLLANEVMLKEEMGIVNIGHREVLKRAIQGLLAPWRGDSAASSPLVLGASANNNIANTATVTSTPSTPIEGSPNIVGAESLRAKEKKSRLMHDLQKAETRLAQRKEKAQRAQHTVNMAEKEIRQLKKKCKEVEHQCAGGGGGAGGGEANRTMPVSTAARKTKKGDAASFMERLQADLQARKEKQLKSAMGGLARQRSGSKGEEGASTSVVAVLKQLQYLCGPDKLSDAMIEVIRVEESAEQLMAKLDELAVTVGVAVESTKTAKKDPLKKAEKLLAETKRVLFMSRLREDLSERVLRKREAEEAEAAQRLAAAKANQETDLKEAKQLLTKLGWPMDRDHDSGDGAERVVALLSGLLKRAMNGAAKGVVGGSGVDDDADGLAQFAASVSVSENVVVPTAPPSAVPSSEATEQQQQQQQPSTAAPPTQGDEKKVEDGTSTATAPQLPPILRDVVSLLAAIHIDDLKALDALKDPQKKLLGVYRALRSQQFLRDAKEKQQEKLEKLREARRAQHPPKKQTAASKEATEAFMARLADDTVKRLRNKEELEAKAREEEKAKMAPSLCDGGAGGKKSSK